MKQRSAKKSRENAAYLKLRQEVLEGCDWTCALQVPGVCLGRATNTHHKLERSLGGKDVRENLLPVCGSGTTGCHGEIHRRPAWAFENGYLIHSWESV